VYVCLVFLFAIVLNQFQSTGTLRAQTASGPGGFVEDASSTATRPRPTAGQIAGFVPSRGRFTFPAPYGTEGARITNAGDCSGGSDCVLSVGYSYWRNINNHAGSSTMLIVLGLSLRAGGTGPTLFSYDKNTGATQKLGPLFGPNTTLAGSTGEGWYFSGTVPTMYYVFLGSKLMRMDVISKAQSTVFDAASYFGSNRIIWQIHSSTDDRVHSFTLRDSSLTDLGCGVYLEDTRQFRFFPAQGDYDECQIDKSGRYLVIKENWDGVNGEDNVIHDLVAGTQQVLLDPDGAGGHSDAGFGYQVAEDNWNSQPGAVRAWTFGGGEAPQGRLVFHATDWGWKDNHIAHSNARGDLSLSQQHACSSNASYSNLPRANEVLCFRLDGSLKVLVAAPLMTDLNASGGGSYYDKLPKGNLDPTGEYFIWTTNMGGQRQDAFIVRIPLGKFPPPLDGSSAPTVPTTPPSTTSPLPAPSPVADDDTSSPALSPVPATSGGSAVLWTQQVNTVVNGSALGKQSGCSGCQDAGAVSQQQITSGDGHVEFTVGPTGPLLWVGLSNGNPGTSTSEIVFAFRLQNGYAEVRERGMYLSDVPVAEGDRLRVQVAGGRVSYAKNGRVFYTSRTAPQYPLLVDTAFQDFGGSISNAVIAAASTGGTTGGSTDGNGGTTAPITTESAVAGLVAWTGASNVAITNGGLQKTGGCDGCPDAGAISQQTIGANGYVEFERGAAAGLHQVALSAADSFTPGAEFAFRIRYSSVEVRERGIYRTDARASSTDTLRIEVTDGTVRYYVAGALIYTSTVTPSSPLRVNTTIYDPYVSTMPAVVAGE
jgi:hypothetical protein